MIVVLTKNDVMKAVAIGELRDQGFTMKEAMERAGKLGKQILNKVVKRVELQLCVCKYPPKEYLSLGGKHHPSLDMPRGCDDSTCA